MTDFIYIIILSSMMWFVQVSTEYEQEMDAKLSMYGENMAVLWVEAEATTERLKQCQKKRKR